MSTPNVLPEQQQSRIAVWIVLAIIVPLILVVLSGFTMDLRCVPELKQKVQVLESQIAPMQDDLQTMHDDLQEIKTDLKWITKQMGK